MPDTILIVVVVGFVMLMALKDVGGGQSSEMPIIQITQVPRNQSSGCLTTLVFFVGLGILAVLITHAVHP